MTGRRIKGLVACGVVLGVTGFFAGPPLYEAIYVTQTIWRSQATAREGNHDLATRWLAGALRRYPDNRKLLDAAADFQELRRSSEAMTLRKKRLDLEPADRMARLDYIESLLLFRQRALAADELQALPGEQPQDTREAHLWGTLCFQESKFKEAAEAFGAAEAREPEEEKHRVNRLLAELFAGGENAGVAAEALASYAGDERFADASAAARLLHALREERDSPPTGALERLEHIDLASPHYRTYLQGLRRWRPEQLEEKVDELWRSSPGRGLLATAHLRWLISVGASDVVVQQFLPLDTGLIRARELILLEAEIAVQGERAGRLQRCLEKDGWREMPVLLNTFQLWLVRERPEVREIVRDRLLDQVTKDPDAALFSASYLQEWGMHDEAQPVWEALACSQHRAWELGWMMAERYLRQPDKANRALDFFRRLHAARPDQQQATGRLLYLELLFGNADDQLEEMARKWMEGHPEPDRAAVIHAWSRLENGNDQEARMGVRHLALDQMTDPSSRLAMTLIMGPQWIEAAPQGADSLATQLTWDRERERLAEALAQPDAYPDRE